MLNSPKLYRSIPTPSEQRFATFRKLSAALALFFFLALIYGSMVPLTPRQLSWDQAVAKFGKLPWLQLGVYHRADWVANILVVLPAGWFAAAAVDLGRRSRGPLLWAIPLIVGLLSATVILIEFCQVWFPPRTQSKNDIAAGLLGALAGPMLWLLCGRAVFTILDSIRHTRLTQIRVLWAVVAYAILNLIYAVLPLDVMVDPAEWSSKLSAGRLILWPTASLDIDSNLVRGLLLAGLRTSIVAFAISLYRGPLWGLMLGTGFALLCELVQIPIYTRTASSLDVLAGVAGACGGLLVAGQWERVNRWMRRPLSWGLLFLGLLLLINLITLGRSGQWISDPEWIQQRWASFFAWPFVKYYYTSEFAAGTNLLSKLLSFAIVGFVLKGAQRTAPARFSRSVAVVGWLSIGMVAVMLEIAQVYLPPQIPDAADVCIYIAGAMFGYGSHWMFSLDDRSVVTA